MSLNDPSFLSYHPGRGSLVFLRARQAIAPAIKGRQRICRGPPGACVATSASSSLPSLSWSTCATVKTASAGRACHGAAPRIFRAKPFASMVRTRSIQERVTPERASTTISARPAGPLCVGPARRAPRDLGFRSARSPIHHSPPLHCRFGRKGDTRGRLTWKTWRIGTRNRRRADAPRGSLTPETSALPHSRDAIPRPSDASYRRSLETGRRVGSKWGTRCR